MPKFLISIFLILLGTLCFAQESNPSPEQVQVWNMEEKYWQIIKAQDSKGYMALWDENQVAWPYGLPAPIRKDEVRTDPFGVFHDVKMTSARLEPKAVQVFKDIAITYYTVTGTYVRKDDSTEVETLRISHIWRKSDGGWLIIGGMSSPPAPSK